MKIKISDGGKRFNREWIFRHADLEFESGQPAAITGPNGSGKSTLLQCIAGMIDLSEGSISYEGFNHENVYRQISFSAPYLELVEEMTLLEFLEFHSSFKPFLPGITINDIIVELELEHAAQKQIRYYSSGMKQRVKLAQAIFSNTAILLLDEPCSNLDEKGIRLYHSLIGKYCMDRIVLVCSNDPVEFSFCKIQVDVMSLKQAKQVKN